MTENPLVRLNRMGQSVWYDNIRRGLFASGELQRMVSAGELRGVTSNPTIFENAIAHTDEYLPALRALSAKHCSAEEAYERLALEDIRAAADLFLPVYQESRGQDGYISLEVSPALAQSADATYREAGRLSRAVDRPNLMIKIPGTLDCLDAVRRTIADGICVNVTLLFSVRRYREVMEALCGRIERPPRARIAARYRCLRCVVFCLPPGYARRPKTGCDAGDGRAKALRGKAAIANTKLAYQEFLAFRASQRWLDLTGGRCEATAPAVGVYKHQRPSVSGHVLRRGPDRPG